MPQDYADIPLSSLSIGTVLSAPIFDPGSGRTKLLGKSIEINEMFLRQLRARGIESVSISKRDLASVAAGSPQGNRKSVSDHHYSRSSLTTEQSESIEHEMYSPDLKTTVQRQVDWPLEMHEDHYDHEAHAESVHQHEQRVAYVDDLFVDLTKGRGVNAEGISDLCRESIQAVLKDKDLFVCLGINPYNSDYPSRHSLHVCSVAISIGVMLGLDCESLVDLGTGCLVHDVGMLKLDQRLYRSKRVLNSKELEILAEHPIRTIDMLADCDVEISPQSRLVAYQMHERCNGSGYPRGIMGEDLHALSKIAAVADTYVGLVSNRWHRRGMLPYFAIEKVLYGIPQRLYDAKVVRGLLHTISLFPVGSFVELSDGRLARVVRTTRESYMLPVVELWNEKHRQFEPDLVNLVEEPGVQVRRAIAMPAEK